MLNHVDPADKIKLAMHGAYARIDRCGLDHNNTRLFRGLTGRQGRPNSLDLDFGKVSEDGIKRLRRLHQSAVSALCFKPWQTNELPVSSDRQLRSQRVKWPYRERMTKIALLRHQKRYDTNICACEIDFRTEQVRQCGMI